jgi:hypothetical protein
MAAVVVRDWTYIFCIMGAGGANIHIEGEAISKSMIIAI